MAEILRQGSRGAEVRRLQKNLNAAIGCRHGMIAVDGIFGPRTKRAVEDYQRDFQLKLIDGIVGPETRTALATRVLIIQGNMSRSSSPPSGSTSSPPLSPRSPPPPTPAPPPPANPPVTAPTPVGPQQPASPPASPFLIQLQPAFGLTPPPFVSRSPAPTPPGPAPSTLVAGQLAVGIVYRTASDGPHWEFGGRLPAVLQQSQSADGSALHLATAGQRRLRRPLERRSLPYVVICPGRRPAEPCAGQHDPGLAARRPDLGRHHRRSMEPVHAGRGRRTMDVARQRRSARPVAVRATIHRAGNDNSMGAVKVVD